MSIFPPVLNNCVKNGLNFFDGDSVKVDLQVEVPVTGLGGVLNKSGPNAAVDTIVVYAEAKIVNVNEENPG